MLLKAVKKTELKGKEYKRILVNSKVEITHLLEVKCRIKSDLEERIWGRRRCFACGAKFEDGDTPAVAITKKGKNKIICEKCSKEMKGVK